MRLALRSVASASSWLLPLRPRVLVLCLTGVGSEPAISTLGLCGRHLADDGSPKGGRASDLAVPRAQLGLWLLDSAGQSSSWKKRMRNSCVELKTSLRSFWWAGGRGPTLGLSSGPTPAPAARLPRALFTALGVEVPWDCPALCLRVGSWA